MDSQKIKLIITLALIPLMVLLLINNLKPKKKPAARTKAAVQAPDKAAVQPAAGPVRAPVTEDELSGQEQRALADWGRNPFARMAQEQSYSNATLELRGVSVGGDKHSYAYINDEIVTVGDIIAEYEVREIDKNRVKLERRGESFYLVLPED